LRNAVKAYFRRGEWDSARYDKLLYKNIVPFGKPRGRKPLAESPLGHLVLAKIMDNVLPMTRRDKYEKPIK